VNCVNQIPLSSGLGSSAAAKLTGLLGANTLLGKPLTHTEILNLGTEMEGHPDNVAPAMLGGLVVSTMEDGNVVAHRIVSAENAPSLHITVVLPEFHLPTPDARRALPQQVPLKDAVHNISRTVLVAEAFRNGDTELLGKAMTDTLHQPHRLPLIPGAQAAMDAAKGVGAAAAALSGAGPSVIAFSAKQDPAIGEAMKRAFEERGLQARIFPLKMSNHGAEVQIR
jgi:homoserine kinase